MVAFSLYKAFTSKSFLSLRKLLFNWHLGVFFVLSVCLSVAILSSCSWLKQEPLPNVAIPSNFNSQPDYYQNIHNLPYLAWWHRLDDAMLNKLIDQGLSNNLDLKIAASNLEKARGELKEVKLSWLPFINIYGGYSTNPSLGNIGTFYGIWPQYSINILKMIKLQQQATYNLKIAKTMQDSVRLVLIGQIAASYFSLRAQQKQLFLIEDVLSSLNQLIAMNNKERDLGLKTTIDIANTIINKDKALMQLAIIKHNITLSNNALCYLLNQNPHSLDSSLTEKDFSRYNFFAFNVGALPTAVLHNRPDLIIAKYRLMASGNDIALANSGLFPIVQLDAFMGYGSTGGTYGYPNTYARTNDQYLNWGINPATFGQIDQANGSYHMASYQYIQTVRRILKDVDNAYSANVSANSVYSNMQNALQSYASKYQLQQSLAMHGIISNQELLTSKIEFTDIALSANQAHLKQALALVNLYQELAGGYKVRNEDDGQVNHTAATLVASTTTNKK